MGELFSYQIECGIHIIQQITGNIRVGRPVFQSMSYHDIIMGNRLVFGKHSVIDVILRFIKYIGLDDLAISCLSPVFDKMEIGLTFFKRTTGWCADLWKIENITRVNGRYCIRQPSEPMIEELRRRDRSAGCIQVS